MKPLVSIVIPNYNHASFLKQRIDSVLQQSYQDFELFILDDYSTDDSLTIINTYQKHPKVKEIIINKSNSGSLFKQWVKAIELADGKYLWIAESDDFAHVDFLKDMVSIAEQNQEIGLVFSDSLIIDKSSKVINQASKSNKALANFKKMKHFKMIDRNMVLDSFVADLIIWNASSVLFLTEAIKKVDFEVLQTLKNAGDLFTYTSIALEYDIIYLNKPLNNMRKHGDNTTERSIASGALFKDRIIIMQYFFKKLNSLSNSKEYLKMFLRRHFLTAVDFKLFSNMNSLLKTYFNSNVLTFSSYFSLSLYVRYCSIFKNAPFRYRAYIKKVLANNT